jgi:hypothetical protein
MAGQPLQELQGGLAVYKDELFANKVDFPAPLGSTNPIRSPRLTWSDTSSKSARPAKDFESCETVSITESAQCSLVRCLAQLVNHESRKGISEIEGKAVRVAASEWSRRAAGDIDGKTKRSNARERMSQSGSRTSFNQPSFTRPRPRQARMDTNHKSICLRLGSACGSRAGCGCPAATNFARVNQERGKLCSGCRGARLALLSAFWLPSRWMKFSEPGFQVLG